MVESVGKGIHTPDFEHSGTERQEAFDFKDATPNECGL